MIFCILIVLGEIYALLDNSGLLKGRYNIGFLGYYTNLSNILVLFFFLLKLLSVQTSAIVDLTITMIIAITFFVYHFMLSPSQRKAHKEGKLGWNFFSLTNLLLHYINPMLTILYWLLYSSKEQLRWFDGLAFIVVPTAYCVYILIRKKLNIVINKRGGFYPYDFMNVDKLGWKRVVLNNILLMVFFGVLGIVFALLASLL